MTTPILYHGTDQQGPRVTLLTKHYTGLTQAGNIDPAYYADKIRNGLPNGNQPGLPEEFTGACTIDLEDSGPNGWRIGRKPEDQTEHRAAVAMGSLIEAIAIVRATVPEAEVGLYQHCDLAEPDGSDAFWSRWWMLKHVHEYLGQRGNARIEFGGYHLWRAGAPDQERDWNAMELRRSTAESYGTRAPVYVWLWSSYQGGGLIPVDAFRSWCQRFTAEPGFIDGAILFQADTAPASHVAIFKEVFESAAAVKA